jgi:hypothetical protein
VRFGPPGVHQTNIAEPSRPPETYSEPYSDKPLSSGMGNDSTSTANFGVNCSTGVRNVPVVPFSSRDADGDGIGCESDLLVSGGLTKGPVPKMSGGKCPKEFQVGRRGAYYAN